MKLQISLAAALPLLSTWALAAKARSADTSLERRQGITFGALDFSQKGMPYTQIVLSNTDGAANNGEMRLDIKKCKDTSSKLGTSSAPLQWRKLVDYEQSNALQCQTFLLRALPGIQNMAMSYSIGIADSSRYWGVQNTQTNTETNIMIKRLEPYWVPEQRWLFSCETGWETVNGANYFGRKCLISNNVNALCLAAVDPTGNANLGNLVHAPCDKTNDTMLWSFRQVTTLTAETHLMNWSFEN